ncbi:putative phosphatidate phosphatase [Helianthus annuus]|uniref:phosphatidate phosphatase n=1 Tax=Helianthus annuus TaxID=4232 RepID=A0A251VSW0_HELAN|nr:phosphatidate phosphatase PAH1 [Helianthus annuus]KAF5823560.1 putative phosphatidate phosphatase [Helianthus annuus]KAJ0624521.1 putative phosphatidate phosphatase [Helianthus annuus]KAJ0628272.1 putative phosphatidate phosphatase [Helianthus annuus]
MISRVGSYLSQSVYSVATPFHPFGGAVDIIVVQQQDGSFRSTPWYVRFGKFQGVLKGAEKVVKIEVNGVEADFHMYLDNSGEAYFIKEITPEKDNDVKDSNGSLDSTKDDEKNNNVDVPFRDDRAESTESDSEKRFYEFQDEQASSLDGSVDLSDFGSNRYDNLENDLKSNDSEVVLFSVDGQILSAPITSMEENTENVQLSTPQFHLGPVEAQEFEGDLDLSNESTWAQYLSDLSRPNDNDNKTETHSDVKKEDETEGVKNAELVNLEVKSESTVSDVANGGSQDHESLKLTVENGTIRVNVNSPITEHKSSDVETVKDEVREECERAEDSSNRTENEDGCTTSVTEEPQSYYDDNGNFDGPKQTRIEISLCGNLLRPGMGLSTAAEAFNAHRVPEEEFKVSATSIIKNDSLIIKIEDKYFTWEKAAHHVLGMAAYGLEMPVDPTDAIPVEWCGPREDTGLPTTPSGRRWRLWPIPFRRAKTLEHNASNISGEDVFLDSESVFDSPQPVETTTPTRLQSPQKQFGRTHVPTTEQISSLNLKDGQNMVSFIFSTRVLGVQKVDAHIYLWKWNARIVISDVDGTITKSDVLGQFMPLVGKDWTQSGVARLFSAIKENGYQLLFLSARAIVQAYLTRSFLVNLKQDGKALPNGPVVISPDGLFPSLFREVIRRAPHEFKIACLEDIKALFPSDYNPFYAGFGNRDTDELSYRKIGIPKGKIFIINPKGEVAISHRIDMKGKSYTSLHTLVNDMFPPTSMVEQEDYNSWNYWRVPLPDVEL